MAFFKFRKSSDETPSTPLMHDSLEAMRRRAKYRVIGSAVLVLVGVLGFPLLFDKQPRPISVNMPIDIPDRNKSKPLPIPAKAALATPVAPAPTARVLEKKTALEASSLTLPPPKAIEKAAPMLPTKALAPPTPAPKPAPAPKPVAKVEDSEKVKALLNGQGIDKATETMVGRYVVQVGAFADPVKARETRLQLEQAGLKTYTHVAQTKEGPKIRVRVGPFNSKAEADKAAQKMKSLKLSATVLTL